jgi:hypothetical protein
MNSIFCTAYAAPVSYYKAYMESDMNVLEMHEHFIKQTIRNRCEISTANGKLILTVPLSERKNNMSLKEVRICYRAQWQNQHIKTLVTAYQSSPFFEFYIDELLAIYRLKPENLSEWNRLIHQQILNWLKLHKNFELSTNYFKTYEQMNDFRNLDWQKQAYTSYHQVFENKVGFIPNLSIFDLLFNCGNQAINILKQ